MRAERRLALQALADLGGLRVWLKQTGKGGWGLSAGWDVSKCSEAPGGLAGGADGLHWKSLSPGDTRGFTGLGPTAALPA